MGKGATALGILLVFVLLGIVIFCVMEATGTDSRPGATGKARRTARRDPVSKFSKPTSSRIKRAGRTVRTSHHRNPSSRNSTSVRKTKPHRAATGRTPGRTGLTSISSRRTVKRTAPATSPSGIRPRKAAPGPAASNFATAAKPGSPAPTPAGGPRIRPADHSSTTFPKSRIKSANPVLGHSITGRKEKTPFYGKIETGKPKTDSKPGTEKDSGTAGIGHVAAISFSSGSTGVYRSSWPALEPRNPLETLPRSTARSPSVPSAEPSTPRNAISPSKENGRSDSSARPRFVTYTVKEGENLWRIAETYLHDGARWREILKANPDLSKDGSSLRAGQKIRIPLGVEKKKPKSPPVPTIKGARLYTIEEGDTLWDLAKYFYGDPSMSVMKEILAANPGLDPDVLPVGRKIQLPPIPGKGPKRKSRTADSLSTAEIK